MSERQRENEGLSRELPNQSPLASGVACNQIYQGNQRKNANNAMAAALMMRAQIHPSTCMPRELTRFPITRRSLVSSQAALYPPAN